MTTKTTEEKEERKFRVGYSCGMWDAINAIREYNYKLSDMDILQKEVDEWAADGFSTQTIPPGHWQLLGPRKD